MTLILDLPHEILADVLAHLEPQDLLNAALTCSIFASQIQTETFWNHKISFEFGREAIDHSIDPLTLYKHLSNPFTPIAKNFSIAWVDNPSYWVVRSDKDSIFPEIASLKSVSWLDLMGSRRRVPPGTYKVFWGIRMPLERGWNLGSSNDNIRWKVSLADPIDLENSNLNIPQSYNEQQLVVDETFPLASGSYRSDPNPILHPPPHFHAMRMDIIHRRPVIPTEVRSTESSIIDKGWVELRSKKVFKIPHNQGPKDVLFNVTETSGTWKSCIDFDYVRLERVDPNTPEEDPIELSERENPKCWEKLDEGIRTQAKQRVRNNETTSNFLRNEAREFISSPSLIFSLLRSFI